MIIDLFAGPGGWDVGAQQLGLDPWGIETDAAARDTRDAAGLLTAWDDVTTYGMPDGMVDGLIASPPCQTFSMAGKGAGRVALEQVLHGVKRVATGEPIPYDEYDDIRTGLVLEPLRYALELEPEWIAWEQVPTVQPVWDACAEVLREDGYHVWTGHLHAEQYGVPQTRKRSVLIASRTRRVRRPAPTHSRFYSRNPSKLDEGVAKWVSMAEALGWSDGRTLGHWRGAGTVERHGERPVRTMDEPAFTMAGGGAGSGPLRWQLRNNTSANAAVRHQDEPAPTLYFGQRMNGVYWESAPTGGETYWQPVPASVTDTAEDVAWVYDRPSPTIVGSFAPDVVAAPGYRTTVSRQNAKGSVRVTVQEAAVLQSFPADYPWQGSKTKQYQQVGNAIPPRLALHVLSEATGLSTSRGSISDATGGSNG